MSAWRKMSEENREFDINWEDKYFFVNNNGSLNHNVWCVFK